MHLCVLYVFCTSILCIFISNSADVFVVGEVNAVRPQQRAPRDGVSSFISSHNIEIDLSTDAFLCEIHLCCAWERRIAITIYTFIHSLSAAAFCKQRNRNSSEPVSLLWLGERWLFLCMCTLQVRREKLSNYLLYLCIHQWKRKTYICKAPFINCSARIHVIRRFRF